MKEQLVGGGPAFPATKGDSLTLADCFAAFAMVAILIRFGYDDETTEDAVSKMAYEQAYSMLQERDEYHNPEPGEL